MRTEEGREDRNMEKKNVERKEANERVRKGQSVGAYARGSVASPTLRRRAKYPS